MTARRLKGQKISKNQLPSGHSKEDFQCFGPPATEDGGFENTKLCDMGCFRFGDIDSNKYYHGSVVKSKINENYYAYFEYGRTGAVNPSFQFIEGPDEATAQSEYEYQMHIKNDKRGEWVDRGAMGKVLQPKEKKDCYLVRPQTTRSTGLPDARTIVHSVTKSVTSSTKKSDFDKQSSQLLSDLNMATTDYTRGAMVNDAIPTDEAIIKGRAILNEATKLTNKLKSDAAVLASSDLGDLTSMMYSLVPKKKNRKDKKSSWWLTPFNISQWRDDLDAFEQALQSIQGVTVSDMPFHLQYLDRKRGVGADVVSWMKQATRNNHGHVRDLKVYNVYEVERDTLPKFSTCQKKVAKQKPNLKEKPLHQRKRFDLDDDSVFKQSGTYLLFHGTRTVNVTGILGTGLRLPKQLSNVSINGAMYGSGLYFADDWKKSAGYCSYAGSYYGGHGGVQSRKAFMFICDVVVGEPHMASGPRGYTEPPQGTHSIYAKGGRSSVANNEFIVFNGHQQNLRYLVEFEEGY